MRPVTVTQAAVGASAPVVLDYLIAPFQVSVACKIAGGPPTFTVEHTYDDPFAAGFDPATATWFPNAGITGKTTNAEGAYTAPVRAVRVNMTAGTGSVTMMVLQAGTGN